MTLFRRPVNGLFWTRLTPETSPMRRLARRTTKGAAAAALATISFAAAPQPAAAYDMDCKVILCLAGGFPSGCDDAYSYMVDRITRFPNPLPPFGFCAMSDGSEYASYDADWRRLRETDPSAWWCPEGSRLRHSVRRDEGRREVEAFCYTDTSERRVSLGEGEFYTAVRYLGRRPARRLNHEIQITLEPGTAAEFRSPTYAINTRSGTVVER